MSDRSEVIRGIREVLPWSLPALVLGLALRLAISTALPLGYYHYDTHDFLLTVDQYVHEGEWRVHKKKVPLVPAMYVAVAASGAPLLRVVPMVQHLAGAAGILVFALLLRAVCPAWKALIIPATALFALHPAIVWYEHTLLAESLFLVFVTLSALCAVAYHRQPHWPQWISLLVSLSFAALTRPEGKILILVAPLLLATTHFLQWRPLICHGAALLAWAMILLPVTRTSQTGVMPLASVIHWMPDQTRAAKGAEPLLLPIRDKARAVQGTAQRHETATRKALSNAVRQFFTDHPGTGNPRSDREVNDFCRRLALKIYFKNWFRVPALAFEKYLMTIDEATSGRFDERWLRAELHDTLARNWERVLGLSRQLAGQTWRNEGEATAFFDRNFLPQKTAWFDSLMMAWQRAAAWPSWQSRPAGRGGVLALPAFYLLGLCGALIGCIAPGRSRLFHLCWVMAMGAMAFAVFAVAGTEARFRFVFEPFALLYAAIAIGALVSWFQSRRRDAAPIMPAERHVEKEAP